MQMGVVNITGAGIAGLTLARSLKNLGVRSVVFEKNPNPARHNYGMYVSICASISGREERGGGKKQFLEVYLE